ncbi:MAG: hypothetical protein LBG67_03760 [Campylobacteraceae bacterium]|jgi:hypothetical protein|nr:hypothetical protein [Campylobacteraceae bacterium]
MNKILYASLVLFLSLIFVGCVSKTPVKMTNTDIQEMANNLSIQQIERSIYKAATEAGWRLYKVRDGHLMGDYYIEQYSVSVDITYTQDSYEIIHNSSKNLKYDGKKILSPYNEWIEELDAKIQRAIMQTSSQM